MVLMSWQLTICMQSIKNIRMTKISLSTLTSINDGVESSVRKYHRLRFIYSKQFKLFEPHLAFYYIQSYEI